LKNKRYYQDKAAYMRELAKSAQTEALRKSCLEAAETYEAFAEKAREPKPDTEGQP
jgi:hypothetical protein